MTEETLKPELRECPFCGKPGKLEKIPVTHENGLKEFWFWCEYSEKCCGRHTLTTEEEAIAAWNRRV